MLMSRRLGAAGVEEEVEVVGTSELVTGSTALVSAAGHIL